MQKFIKKHWGNILFFGLMIFMFTPAGLPLRALLIKGVSFITSRVENLEIDKEEQLKLDNFQWQLVSNEVQSINLADYKGRVVLINNWATWCPPCVAEMPSLARLYHQYKDKIVFLFIAQDKPEKVQMFLQKNGLNIPVYYMQSNPPAMLQTGSIPTTFIIDKEGYIVVKKTGAADWDSGQVHRILDKLVDSIK